MSKNTSKGSKLVLAIVGLIALAFVGSIASLLLIGKSERESAISFVRSLDPLVVESKITNVLWDK